MTRRRTIPYNQTAAPPLEPPKLFRARHHDHTQRSLEVFSMSEQTGAQKLARWVVGLRYQDLSSEVMRHVSRCMLDTLGVQIRGATLPWVQPVYQYVRSIGGTGSGTVTYYGDRLAAPYAAYANSAFSYSCELQHHGSPESAHPGVIVVPTVQALGEQLGSTGQEIASAMVAGYQVQGVLGAALFQPTFKLYYNGKTRHFHPQGILGVFSAAAAAGKLLKLSEEQLTHAFAIAGSHASTILEYDQAGGEVKRIHGAIAARSGMQSAFLAKAGLTGPLSVFEGRHGFFAAFGGAQADSDQLFSDIGQQPYCITRCRFRVYPTIGSTHNALDIINDLIEENAFDHRDVESIRVGMRERAITHVTTITRPHDVISAQASLGFSLGVRMVKGSNNLEMYIDPKLWRNPEVLAIADKLEAYPLENEAAPRTTRLTIKFKNGQVLEKEQGHARGSEKRPFSQEIIEGKFKSLAGVSMSPDRMEQIIQTVAQLDQLPSISKLVPLLQKQ